MKEDDDGQDGKKGNEIGQEVARYFANIAYEFHEALTFSLSHWLVR